MELPFNPPSPTALALLDSIREAERRVIEMCAIPEAMMTVLLPPKTAKSIADLILAEPTKPMADCGPYLVDPLLKDGASISETLLPGRVLGAFGDLRRMGWLP